MLKDKAPYRKKLHNYKCYYFITLREQILIIIMIRYFKVSTALYLNKSFALIRYDTSNSLERKLGKSIYYILSGCCLNMFA